MMRMTDPLTAVGLPEGGALCAVSGGLDSMCLLEMTVRQGQKQGRRVAAAHFNHQLRGAEADRDEAFVRDWCAAREIPFFAGRGDVRAFAEKTGRTVEEAARQLRYKFLEETRRREGFGCILTAHHADDSAETMLLNLLRGTGLKGLTGIPETFGVTAHWASSFRHAASRAASSAVSSDAVRFMFSTTLGFSFFKTGST